MTAVCAHINVDHLTEDFPYEGDDVFRGPDVPPLRAGAILTRNWWECRDCKRQFQPMKSEVIGTDGSSLPLNATAEEFAAAAANYARTSERLRCALIVQSYELRMTQINEQPRTKPGEVQGPRGRGNYPGTWWIEAVEVLRMAEAKIRSGESSDDLKIVVAETLGSRE